MELEEKVLDLLAGGMWYTARDLGFILNTTFPKILHSLETLKKRQQVTRRKVGSRYLYRTRSHQADPSKKGPLSDEALAQHKLLKRLVEGTEPFNGKMNRALLDSLPLPAFVSDARFRILQWSPVLTRFFDPPVPGIAFTDYFRGYPDMLPWCGHKDEPLSQLHFIDSAILPSLNAASRDDLIPSGVHLVRLRRHAAQATEQFFYFSLVVPERQGGIYGFIAPASELIRRTRKKQSLNLTALGLKHCFGQPLNAIASVEASLMAMRQRLSRSPVEPTQNVLSDFEQRLTALVSTLGRVRTNFTVIRENLPGISDLETEAIDLVNLLELLIEQERSVAKSYDIELEFECLVGVGGHLVWSTPYPLSEAIHCLIRNAIHSAEPNTAVKIGFEAKDGNFALSIRNKTRRSIERAEFLRMRIATLSGADVSGTALAINVARALNGQVQYRPIAGDYIETLLLLPTISVLPINAPGVAVAHGAGK